MSGSRASRIEIQHDGIVFKIGESNQTLEKAHRFRAVEYTFVSKEGYNLLCSFLAMSYIFIK